MKWLINIYLVLFLVCLLTACGKENKVTETVLVPTPVPTPAPTFEEDVNNLIEDENEYRTGLGQSVLSKGLSCTLYTITGGNRIQSTSGGNLTLTGISQVATYLYQGLFNQPNSSTNDGMNVLPEPLKSLYKNMYLLRCQGQIAITETGYQQFVLTSDDASLLYIDGVKVIDNDNAHGTTSIAGMRYMRRGVHTFRLDYAQFNGNQSLVLKMNNSLINPVIYAH